MKEFGRNVIFLSAVAVASLIFSGTTLYAAQIEMGGGDFVPGEVLVLVKESNLSDNELISIIESSSPVPITSVEKLHNFDLPRNGEPYGKRLLILEFNEKDDPRLVADAIKSDSLVLIAEPNFIGYGSFMPDDTYFELQWGLHNVGQFGGTPDADIDAPEAWDVEMGNDSVVIAVVDTGVDLDHEDLIGKLLPGWDAVDDDFVPEDDHGHGTMVIGVAGASTNNGLGVAGSCAGCVILPVRAGYNYNGAAIFTTENVWKALEFAVNNPGGIVGIPENPRFAKVISMSFGFSGSSGLLLEGIEDAYNAGAVLVAAAGNNNSNSSLYPAAYDEVIAVAATDDNDAKAGFSNYGAWVDVAAPGVSVFTTNLENDYTGPSGTSFSTPYVAGALGLMLSRPNAILGAAEMRQALIDTSDPTTGFPAIVGGRVNAYRLLSTNIAPLLTPIGNKSVEERELLLIDTDAGDGNGDPLTYFTDAGNVLPSSFTFNQETGVFEWRPTLNDAGQYAVTFSVTDGRDGWDSEIVTITVINRPSPPPGKVIYLYDRY